MAKNNELPAPTGAELEILSILWPLPDEEALKLAEIHQLVANRRARNGAPAPMPSTISSTLRGALAKGLLREVLRSASGTVTPAPSGRRGSLVASRSPQTAYQTACKPEDVMVPMFRTLTEAYADRYEALIDMARALDLPDEVIDRIRKLLPKK